MAMKVTFDLTDNDLKYFRRVMKEVRAKHRNSSEQEILNACRALIEGISATRAPDFVRSRVEKLSVLIEMLEDTEWGIAGRDRERVVRGMAYFAEPDDIVGGVNALLETIQNDMLARASKERNSKIATVMEWQMLKITAH